MGVLSRLGRVDGNFSISAFQNRGKSRVRDGSIAAEFVFWTGAFRRISEFAWLWHQEVGISCKNQENTGAISGNGHGKPQGLRVVVKLC